MFSGYLKFDKIPEIGFAHHFYAENYSAAYNSTHKSFEIVYINSGGIEADFEGERIIAEEGSIFVLFRHLPITLKCKDGKPQSHSTVQAALDFDFTLLRGDDAPEAGGLLLPFIVPPCKENEGIRQELYSIISDISIAREENSLSSSLRFLHIMQQLDKLARTKRSLRTTSTIISYRIKKFVSENISKSVTLADISEKLGKTPGYINQVFKETNGITITQYINREKMQLVASLLHNHGLSFRQACDNVGIGDISYGYRLFKKHTGVTPNEFLHGEHIRKVKDLDKSR